MDEHHRRSIRLPDYDYTQNGAYVVTICTHGREALFGEIVDGEMRLNDFGRIVEVCWFAIPEHFPHVEIDAFVVMPNHVHGIIVITGIDSDNGNVGARHALPLQTATTKQLSNGDKDQKPAFGKPVAKSVGIIVGSFKSAVTKRINEQRGTPNAPVWQRNFYEQVIRNAATMMTFRDYIVTNPGRWADDRENLAKGSRN